MQIQEITIQSFPTTVTANQARVDSVSVTPNTGASGNVSVGNLDVDGNFVAVGGWTVAMTPEQYAAWGTDDAYAVNCFLSNLGIVPV